MKSVYSFTLQELEGYFISIGETSYRAKQLYNAIYKNFAVDFDEITTINKNLKVKLKTLLFFDKLKLVENISSAKTEKFVFELEDGNIIETVLMRQVYGNSVCVTTQVGCNMGCKFCASGELKKVRDLTTNEIVMQVMEVQKYVGERVSNIVVMGIGEPFDNYDNTLRFVNIINSDLGLAIGSRHITISTSGVVPKIIEFANLNLQVNLAISLHAPNNELRSKLMPINNKYDLQILRDAMLYYCDTTNRRLTIEYILIDGVNDQINHAKELFDYLRGIHCYVNLIPLNSVNDKFGTTPKNQVAEFESFLLARGMNVRIRQEFGEDINAACGQLRAKIEVRKNEL